MAERHTDVPLIWEMANHPKVLDVAQALLGSEDLMLFSTVRTAHGRLRCHPRRAAHHVNLSSMATRLCTAADGRSARGSSSSASSARAAPSASTRSDAFLY
jgi:hypothetical protein